MSAAGFQLKGSGWYATDFKEFGGEARGAGRQGRSEAETKPDAPAASARQDSGSGKVESKTEAKTETKAADKATASASTTSTTGS